MTTRPMRCGHCNAYDSYELKPSAVIRTGGAQVSAISMDEDRWVCGICNKEWRVPIPPDIHP